MTAAHSTDPRGAFVVNDLDAEAVCLAAALVDPNAYPLIADRLRPDRFFSEANRRIWEAIVSVAATGPVDAVAVKGRLADTGRLAQVGGGAYLAQVIGAPATVYVERYAARVAELARLRDLINACHVIIANAPDHMADGQAFLDRAAADVRALADSPDVQSMRHVGDVLREKFESWQKLEADRAAFGARTGFVGLDSIIGGWRPGKLYVLAARPGIGKSAFALNTATAVAGMGGGVAFFSLEMGNDELTDRQLAALSGVPLSAVERIAEAPEGEETDRRLTALAGASQHLSAHPLWIDDRGTQGLADVRARSKRADLEIRRRGGTGLALVVVDYCQLMQEPPGARSREQAVGGNARGLKLTAKEMGVPVLMLSQMNREIEKRSGARAAKPKLSDLRESGSIEQDADTVMFLHRDPDPMTGQPPKEGPAELIVAKQRNGPTGSIELYYRGHITRFDSGAS